MPPSSSEIPATNSNDDGDDNDDQPTPQPQTPSTSATTTSTTDTPTRTLSAREKAAARQKRILAASARRMANVSGEQVIVPNHSAPSPPPPPETTSVETEAVTETTTEGDQPTEGGGEVADEWTEAGVEGDDEDKTPEVTPTEVAAAPKAMGSLRLRQMRSRRFKKQAAEEAEEKGTDASPSTTAVVETPAETVEKTPTIAVPAPSSETQADDEDGDDSKKYLGVAKMRRKMIAKKRESQGDVDPLGSDDYDPKLKPLIIAKSKTPIYLQLLSVVLLFLLGADVGYDSARHPVNLAAHVHTEVCLGDTLLRPLGLTPSTTHHKASREALLQKMQDDHPDDTTATTSEFHSHFDEEEESVPNIDPFFRVDLDELTDQPGILFAAARWAVAVHRLITTVFILYPWSLVKGVLTLPRAIMNVKCPPVLFLLAILIRQAAKYAGAEVYDWEAGHESEDSAEKDSGVDLVGVVSRAIQNFVKGSFPRAIKAYGVFKDAKEDMYVVLCGFLVGVAMPGWFWGVIGGGSLPLGEEL